MLELDHTVLPCLSEFASTRQDIYSFYRAKQQDLSDSSPDVQDGSKILLQAAFELFRRY